MTTDTLAKLAVLCILLPGTAACDKLPWFHKEQKEVGTDDPVEIEDLKTCGPGSISTPQELCPPGRLVGQFPDACPVSNGEEEPMDPGWTVEPLFAKKGVARKSLRGFCRYTWTGDPEAIAALPPNIASQVGPDCRVFPQSPIASRVGPAYQQAFSEGTRPLSTKPKLGSGVTIAVVDTAPPVTKNDQAGHGQAMAAIAGELAGGCVPGLGERDPDCRRTVETWLGLPQTRTGPDPTQGGFYGYQSDLAEGIMAAIDSWVANDAKQDLKSHLVINLSVGWEPEPGEFGNPSPAVQAVRDAIAIGHCRGALTIAASGNRPEGTCFGEATGPGGWEHEPGYTHAQCEALVPEEANAVPVSLPAYHPFLYAATPLDWRGNNLSDVRDNSNARLAATGFGGFDEVDSQSYGPFTGSSVSAAVLSGTAALAWSYFDSLSADEVMTLLFDAGAATGLDASLSLGSSPADQHQVTACGTMQYACDPSRVANYLAANQQQAPAVCSQLKCAPYDPNLPQINQGAWSSAYTAAFGQLASSLLHTSNAEAWSTLECTQCGGEQITQMPAKVKTGTEPEHRGWIVPQPHKMPCPFCRIKGPDLYLTLDPEYDDHVLDAMSVYLYDSAGGSEVLHYDPTSLTQPLNSTTVSVLSDSQLSSVNAGQAPVQAYILMTFTDPTGGTGTPTGTPTGIGTVTGGTGTAGGTTVVTAGNALSVE